MIIFVLVIFSLFPCHSFSFSPVSLSLPPLSLSLPLLSLFLSFSLASLSLSLSFSRSCLSFYLSLFHTCRLPLLLHSCLLIFLSPLSLLLPLCGCLFLSLSFSLPSLYPSLSHTHGSLPICLSFYLFLSLFLTHSCLSFYLSPFSLPSLSSILSLWFFSLSLSLFLSLSRSCL